MAITDNAAALAVPTDPDALPNAYPAVAEAAEAVAALARRAADYDDADAAEYLPAAATWCRAALDYAARARAAGLRGDYLDARAHARTALSHARLAS